MGFYKASEMLDPNTSIESMEEIVRELQERNDSQMRFILKAILGFVCAMGTAALIGWMFF